MENTAFEWPTDSSRYEILGRIGKGAFAKVFKAKCLDNNEIVAVKVIRLEDISVNLEDIRKEVLTLKLCHHDNVLTCHCCFIVDCTLWIVTPLMIKGSFLRILQLLKKSRTLPEGQGFEESIVAYVIKETAQGLKYLHDSNLLHRDVKAGNILVDEKGCVRLADLGVSRVISYEKATTFVGTPCWMAPELMEKKPYDGRADVWSLGITALELFKSVPPYAKYGAMEVFIRVMQNPPGFNSYQDNSAVKPSSAFQAWINSVLKKDVSARYTIDKALTHRWLAMAEEGREKLLELLATVKDLEGEDDSYISNLKEGGGYVRGTTWDFGSLVNINTIESSTEKKAVVETGECNSNQNIQKSTESTKSVKSVKSVNSVNSNEGMNSHEQPAEINPSNEVIESSRTSRSSGVYNSLETEETRKSMETMETVELIKPLEMNEGIENGRKLEESMEDNCKPSSEQIQQQQPVETVEEEVNADATADDPNFDKLVKISVTEDAAE